MRRQGLPQDQVLLQTDLQPDQRHRQQPDPRHSQYHSPQEEVEEEDNNCLKPRANNNHFMNTQENFIDRIRDSHLWTETKILKRNEILKRSGSLDSNLYFVNSGSLRVYLLDGDEEKTIRFGYRNNIIVALDSFLKNHQSDLIIQALKQSEIKIATKKNLNALVENNHEMQKQWIDLMEDLVFQQFERERDLLTSSPQERYKRVFERSPQLFQEIPHRYIASYLRMTPETLSRIKKS